MKRQLLFAALLVIGLNASAQFTKGEKVLGSNLAFNASTATNSSNSGGTLYTETTKNSSFNTIASLGWVKSEKRISGIRLSFYHNHSVSAMNIPQNNYGLGLGYFNQHIKHIDKNFFGFLEYNLNGNYGWSKYISATNYSSKTFNYSVGASANLGIGYRFTKHLIADATLTNILGVSYNHPESKIESSTSLSSNSKGDNFSVSTGLSSLSLNSVAIGFRWVFQ